MLPDIATLAALSWGTVRLRPYVFIFLLAFLVAAARDLGAGRTLGFLLWAWGVAFVAEYASTRAPMSRSSTRCPSPSWPTRHSVSPGAPWARPEAWASSRWPAS